jgi:hypothetical protein
MAIYIQPFQGFVRYFEWVQKSLIDLFQLGFFRKYQRSSDDL